MEPFSRRSVVIGALGVAGATVAGCASTAPASTASQPVAGSATPTPSTPVDATPRWPLTGQPLAASDDPKRVAVAVKVPDNKREHPQEGINDADIVFVELDGYHSLPDGESGTRLMPVYHSKYAAAAAPVRSMRPVDAAIFAPITGIIGSTGAVEWVQKYMAGWNQYFLSKHQYMTSKNFAYGMNMARVYSLPGRGKFYDKATRCYPAKLAKLATKFTDGPQQNYFPWADADQASTLSGQAAKTIKVPWAQKMNWSMTYTWDDTKKVYLRSMPWGPHVQFDGSRVTTQNVMIIKADHVFGQISHDGSIDEDVKHKEPIFKVINGTGKFAYANGGKYVTGTWTKGAVNEAFQFTLDDGTPLKMAPGRTFCELPAANAKVTFKA